MSMSTAASASKAPLQSRKQRSRRSTRRRPDIEGGRDVAILLSIRPTFANRILDGSKTVELRRRPIGAPAGGLVVIYSSAPVQAVVGAARLGGQWVGTLSAVWRAESLRAAVTRAEFDSYFERATRAVAIELLNPMWLDPPVTLNEMRERVPSFNPPQSFSFLRRERLQDAALLELIESTIGRGVDRLSLSA